MIAFKDYQERVLESLRDFSSAACVTPDSNNVH
jgi:hypothetical protein